MTQTTYPPTPTHTLPPPSPPSSPRGADAARRRTPVRPAQVKKGDVIACAGFGAGLSWGATIMRWG